jgi:hypothetical protein
MTTTNANWLLACLLLLAVAIPAAQAQTAGPCTASTTDNDVCDKTEKGINSLIAAATRIAGPIMALTFIASAIAFGTANENAKAIGKKGMISAGIGLAIIVLANGIMLLIQGSFA